MLVRMAGVAFMALVALTLGCGDSGPAIRGSGTLETVRYDLDGFEAVRADDGFHVIITRADVFLVEVEADGNLIERLRVDVRDGALHLALEDGRYTHVTLEARVEMPEVTDLKLTGASTVELDGFTSTLDRRMDIARASRVAASLNAGALSINASGASRLEISGAAEMIRIEASGASHIDARDMPASVAEAYVSAASTVDLGELETIRQIDASGASRVTYGGDPLVEDVNSSGGSRVRRR